MSDQDITTTDSAPKAQTFADFNILPTTVASLADSGITEPFPIQAMTLPVALSGHDIIGQAKTGTGKTLGFGVPLLNKVVGPGEDGFDELPSPGKPQALVVVPTRELAVQVAGDLESASSRRDVRIIQLYGGRAYEPQIAALKRGVEIVVGTPGRMIDLMNQGHLILARAAVVVLDEADEMLDLGFLPDVEKLLSQTPAVRQTMLFSATMPGPVVALARRYMVQPTHIRANDPDDDSATVKNIKQVIYRAHALDKIEVLARILQAKDRGLTIVFTRTKRTASKVSEELTSRGFATGSLHGDLGQGAREQALRAFRHGKIDVLVATDVAARGIDVEDVTHVVNYQCPEDEKVYLHRTGRTGRAGQLGTAVTFVDWEDVPRWSLINKTLDLGVPDPVETYSTSPHLFEDLEIPTTVTGRLPRTERTRAGLGAEEVEDLGETGGRKRSSGGRGEQNKGQSRGRNNGGRNNTRQGGRDQSTRSRNSSRSNDRERSQDTKPADGAATTERTTAGGEKRNGRTRQRRRTRGGQRTAQGSANEQSQ
ncbi:Superfamily II DNA and RNA helicase [Micrococcales bacterium KH10]|nr:Superfamily II DNA and RNA helicase [Micrococcales bacterium KH10]